MHAFDRLFAGGGVLMILFFLTGGTLMAQKNAEGVYGFKAKRIDGKEISLDSFKGKVLLIVNTASKCGFTKQYKPMEELYRRYKDKGFEILAFPANNFLSQEPGTNDEIKKFCEVNFGVTFPLFEKIDVKGQTIHPLYEYLTTQSPYKGAITWNFNKFLIAPDGQVIARFDSKEDPLSEKIIRAIDSALPKSAKS